MFKNIHASFSKDLFINGFRNCVDLAAHFVPLEPYPLLEEGGSFIKYILAPKNES